MTEGHKTSWSLPLAVVLYGTGCVAFAVGLMMAGKIDGASGATAPAWLLALAITDIICATIMFARGDTALGTIAMFLGTLLCVGAAGTILIHMFAPGDPIPVDFEAWQWIGIGAFLLCLMPVVAKQLPSSVFVFLCLFCGIGLVLWGVGLLQASKPLMITGGWLIFAFGVFLYYAGTAVLTNEAYGREVLPLGRPIVSGPAPAAQSVAE